MTQTPVQERIAESVLDLVGNTPLIRLDRIRPAGTAEIVGKLESVNPGGSVKDRIALSMIADAEGRGVIKPGDTIVEPTSGNTGIGLALVGAVKGYKVVLTMPTTTAQSAGACSSGWVRSSRWRRPSKG